MRVRFVPAVLALLSLWLVGVGEARADVPVDIKTVADAAKVDDPRRLYEAGDALLASGDRDAARAIYDRAISQEELNLYLQIRPGLHEALLLERMGDFAAAKKDYEAAFDDDVQTAILVLRIASIHPDRDALVDEAVAHVRDLVARAKKGERAVIYKTNKGEPRFLEYIPDDKVLSELTKNQGELKYCAIDHLDLSAAAAAELPPQLQLSKCVVGDLSLPDRDLGKLNLRAIFLGDVDVGKTWSGEINKSATRPGSRIGELMVRESVFLGRANFQDVHASGRQAMFAMTVFQGPADFRDTIFGGVADFRFSVFGQGANYKGMQLTNAAYFGHTRYLGEVSFRGMRSEQDLFFDSALFEGSANFDKCEWARGATFENSHFEGPVSFNASLMGGRLNMSRTVVEDKLTIKEMTLGGMDFIGSILRGDASFIDVHFGGKVRFSLDDVTRAQYIGDPSPLLPLYRDYQGDSDAESPLTTQSSYGVRTVDDLVARIDGNVTFLNSVFDGFCIFERVHFGTQNAKTLAQFYNTQFLGETHFERTEWFSAVDFSTIFANELSLNEALFHSEVVFDDANVPGRLVLTDARFDDGGELSFYGAQIATFEIDRAQVEAPDGSHRLFYERCAHGAVDRADIHLARLLREHPELDDDGLRSTCYERVADEFVLLRQSFGNRAMAADEDWAYWWIRHHALVRDWTFGSVTDKLSALVAWPVFEVCFGWGVRLANLGFTSLGVVLLFTVLFKTLCEDSVCRYNGDDVKVRDIPWSGMFYISLQAFGAFNTGWDFGEDKGRFRYLNTLETYVGILVLTFFVGAYTRMILS